MRHDDKDPCGALGKRYQFAWTGPVFVCKEYDLKQGYLIVPEVNVTHERWVSERAINRTLRETRI